MCPVVMHHGFPLSQEMCMVVSQELEMFDESLSNSQLSRESQIERWPQL